MTFRATPICPRSCACVTSWVCAGSITRILCGTRAATSAATRTAGSGPGTRSSESSRRETTQDDRETGVQSARPVSLSGHSLTLHCAAACRWLKRQTAFSQFVEPELASRPNLRVMTETRVRRVLFASASGSGPGPHSVPRAIGVECEDVWSRRRFNLTAAREVILSAGVFNSPQLLMLSGIGDRSHLRQMGVPLVAHLPVRACAVRCVAARSCPPISGC